MPVQPQQIASQQKARIYRVGILGAGIFVHLVVCWTVLSLGYVDLQPLEFLALASLSAAGLLFIALLMGCLLYTSPSPRDATLSRMPSSA